MKPRLRTRAGKVGRQSIRYALDLACAREASVSSVPGRKPSEKAAGALFWIGRYPGSRAVLALSCGIIMEAIVITIDPILLWVICVLAGIGAGAIVEKWRQR